MKIFAVLGDPVRFRIVEILASGPHLAGELSDAIVGDFAVSRAAVSHHLRILRDEGLVVVHPEENQRSYRLTWNTLDRIDRVLLDLYEKWDNRSGWPYQHDPLAVEPRRHRLAERRAHPRDEERRYHAEPLLPIGAVAGDLDEEDVDTEDDGWGFWGPPTDLTTEPDARQGEG